MHATGFRFQLVSNPFQSIAKFLLLALLTTVANSALAQQDLRELDHSDYDKWNNLGSSQISNDGKWVSYSISSAKADSESTLFVRRNGSTKQYVLPRASGARFTYDSKFIIYRVPPAKKRVEELKKAKVKEEELPDPQLEILELESGKQITVDHVSSFSLPQKNGQWVAFLRDATEAEKLAQTNSNVEEKLEVTEAGLKAADKKQKLKPRRKDPLAMPESREKQPGSEKKSSQEKLEASGKPSTDKDQDKPDHKKKSTGKTLVLHDLNSGLQRTYPHVVQFRFDKHGTRLALVTSVIADTAKMKPTKQDNADSKSNKKSTAKEQDDAETDCVHIVDLDDLELKTILSGVGQYKSLTFNEQGTRLALLSNKDDYLTKTPNWSIYHWRSGQKEAVLGAQETTAGIPQGWWISPNSTLSFAENNKRVYFSTAPIPEDVQKERKAGKDSAEEKPKAKLDLWHWHDPQLQPQQLLRASAERNRSYRAAIQLKSGKVTQLATKAIPDLRIDVRNPADIAVAATDVPYQKMMSWDYPGYQDTHVIDLNTGESRLLVEKSRARGSLSPEGKYVIWYEPEQQQWFAVKAEDPGAEPVNISQGIKFPLYDELHDTPSLPRSYGSAGWLKDDAAVLIYDRFDIWQLDPSGKNKPVCLTEGQGRKNQIRLRAVRLDREARAIDPAEPIYLTAFNETTKAEGFYRLTLPGYEADQAGKTSKDKEAVAESEPTESLTELIMLDESLGRLNKAEQSDDLLFTRSTFRMYPDLWTSTLDVKSIYRISDANPQQNEYRWGTAELVKWNGKDGQPLEGLLYKPDGFDPDKQYPLMVYFYERNSDNLHRYYVPEAGRSIINFSFYVSRGYVVFVPDIPYRTGEPGPSAANSVLPGVEHLIEQGFIDKAKIGMQGHSWGGYQTAYLVTQTDMFACAESGAPVSNMTSAYGGIRWSSGMSRMFQYEKTQSRIGGNLWDARQKYIDNSPVFFADKINTPLLILHNDQDGAVPWYQGIELFVALRRLEKTCWLLNYNDNPHWVMGDANRLDFAKRMQQFFDFYLMDAPEPEWMAYGIPAVDKGKEFGFDLLEPEQEAKEEQESEESQEAAGK